VNHYNNDGGDNMKMTRRDVLVLALSAAVAGSAWAHGPTRQKVSLTTEIAAPADKVWARVANFHDMSWHPVVARTEGQGGNEVGAQRVLVLKGEGEPTITEQLTRYKAEAMSYSYKITAVDVKVLPVTNYSSHLTVTADGEGKSKVQWRGAFYRGFPNNDPPPELNDQAAIDAVTGVYKSGLDALKAELEK
jgi:hypothetical protein